MLSRLIVSTYAWFLETALWLALIVAGIAGYNATVPFFESLGGSPSPEIAWKVFGAVVFVTIAFIVMAVVAGPILVLIDIRHAVRGIEARLNGNQSSKSTEPTQRRDPTV